METRTVIQCNFSTKYEPNDKSAQHNYSSMERSLDVTVYEHMGGRCARLYLWCREWKRLLVMNLTTKVLNRTTLAWNGAWIWLYGHMWGRSASFYLQWREWSGYEPNDKSAQHNYSSMKRSLDVTVYEHMWGRCARFYLWWREWSGFKMYALFCDSEYWILNVK